ncbi:precorrin-3B C17-methyltransferase [Acetoanaerobium pronyense]|uniref:Precorrin-3B C17-methyltransferase n=1 Tax=Acetoanaerobium pronyense TaxID=1482736 RepID=A0ABS4KIS8_9FIRM|nr:precorrin-3B C(17)-methyltransferase [Acetoanaerobium pronyense]MBP2027692.1 precorrin-3B C17-methyltransferase [Acetoanaerobium pronyense]
MINVVGIGPGDLEMMTFKAKSALEESDVIVGYKTYTNLIMPIIKDKEIVSNGMKQEVQRCEEAIRIAKTGKIVSVVSSGDAGVYGMAGLILELLNGDDMKVNIIPGVTASTAASAILGAPLMHDYCHISLSDLLTPMELIEKRIAMASEGDFVICLYNPRSKGREGHLEKAIEIIKKHRKIDTPLGIVKNAAREKEEKIITTIGEIDYTVVDMTSIVIIGNSSTYVENNNMITPRGYKV